MRIVVVQLRAELIHHRDESHETIFFGRHPAACIVVWEVIPDSICTHIESTYVNVGIRLETKTKKKGELDDMDHGC